MKKLLFFFSTAFLFSIHVSAQDHSCCSKNAIAQFAMLGKDKEFVNSHASPLPFNFQATTGKMVSFNTKQGPKGNAFEVKAEKPTDNYLFIFHEWWGLNDYIKREAERLQKELGNVNVLAIDLFGQKVAQNPEDAQKQVSELKYERGIDIINGAIGYAGSSAKIENIGWCFGGGWSMQAALLEGKQDVGCVMYYGMPETDVKKLKTLNADVLGLFASQDKWINAQVVKKFQEDMKAAGKIVTVKIFNADHAFANPSNPKYNKEATEEANRLAMDYLKKHLH